jgi:predicted deacetylase
LSHFVVQTILLMRVFFIKIKPLTEEEKSQKLAELRDKMGEKRALKAAEEAKEAKANELIRRKAGKVRLKLALALSIIQAINCGLTHIDRKPRR